MEKRFDKLEDELDDLKHQVQQYQEEKERVRAIIGRVGGVPKFQTKLINTIFIVAICISVLVSFLAGDKWRLLMIEAATVILSLKIIYLIHNQMKVSHFEFWILSSLEWRINELMMSIRHIAKKL
jgi:hypothetical protein